MVATCGGSPIPHPVRRNASKHKKQGLEPPPPKRDPVSFLWHISPQPHHPTLESQRATRPQAAGWGNGFIMVMPQAAMLTTLFVYF